MESARTMSPQGRALEPIARLADRVAPGALGLLLAGFVLLDYYGERPGRAGGALIIAFAAITGTAAATARHRLWPIFAVTAPASLLFSWWPGFIVASYYAATTLRRRAHLALFTAASAVALLGLPVLYDTSGLEFALGPGFPTSAFDGVLAVLFLVGLPLVAGLWINARRQVLAGLAERAERLERDQAARTERARAAERTRIAREMHDVVAHKVSLIVLHAGALEVGTSDQDARDTAELIRATGQAALTDLRDVLGVLRSPPAGRPSTALPVLGELGRLLDQSRSAGLPVRRRDEGTPRPLPAAAERAAYRVVQEALTNVHKHAGGAATEVVLRYRPDHLELTVANEPPADTQGAAGPPPPGAGLGLIGLRERLELVGGRLDAGPRPDGGFTVRARIPTTAEEPA
ncbi:sensor histidine kinase [Actinomadura sp. KC06]|uniref:sensor histidine kinase n=1 Tax=Actinomadura sp. KC06 TaxID=2530369 RepID=UPI0014050AAE|nr:sensor histidine kinase [Actinomadura sp. KC06]